jgi:hypothetical protein
VEEALPPKRCRISALAGEGHEGDATGALDCCAKLALVMGAIPGNAAWNDFTALGDQISQALDVFIIDPSNLVGTEATDFLARESLFGRHC